MCLSLFPTWHMFLEHLMLKFTTLVGSREMWTKDIVYLRSDSSSEERFQWNFSGLWQAVGCCHSSSFIRDTARVRLVPRRDGDRGAWRGGSRRSSVMIGKVGPLEVHQGKKSACSPVFEGCEGVATHFLR